ncbi:MAG: hypothetical protein ACRBDL_08320 [Alphaproteobacteria bacterium]
MSLLKINKKAVNNADGLMLFQHSQALQEPLGTPTVFVRDENIPKEASSLFGLFKRRSMRRHSKQFLETSVRLRYGQEYSMEVLPQIRNAVVNGSHTFLGLNLKELNPCAYPVQHVEEDAPYASDSDPGHYKPPLFNLIYAPSEEKSGALIFEKSFENKSNSFPGSASQWHMFLLWHEIGHGTGAGEPQSDAISATICRQAFDQTTFLRSMADYRAAKIFNGLLRYDGLYAEIMQAEDRYGLPTVEALDYINNLPQRLIDALDEETIRNISFQKFDHCNTVPLTVARALYQQQIKSGRSRPYMDEGNITDQVLLNYVKSAQELLTEGGLKDSQERLLRRAGLAFTRIAHGENAYNEDDADILIPEEFQEAEQQDPLSFNKGEFLPD